MSDYSIVNLREADDDTGGRVEGMSGTFGRKYLDSRDLGVSLWTFAPGVRPPFAHSHREQEEAYVVVAGSGRIRLNDEVLDVKPVGRGPRRPGHGARLRGRPGRAGTDRRRRAQAGGRRRRALRFAVARVRR